MEDPGKHYRYKYRHKLSMEEINQRFAVIKMDPYRICDIYNTGGGPREHFIKKALRGSDKGMEASVLIAELRSCLDRWEEMIAEDSAPLVTAININHQSPEQFNE